jgi:hypothetical protein
MTSPQEASFSLPLLPPLEGWETEESKTGDLLVSLLK